MITDSWTFDSDSDADTQDDFSGITIDDCLNTNLNFGKFRDSYDSFGALAGSKEGRHYIRILLRTDWPNPVTRFKLQTVIDHYTELRDKKRASDNQSTTYSQRTRTVKKPRRTKTIV